jgi:hypothetical protein
MVEEVLAVVKLLLAHRAVDEMVELAIDPGH